MDVEHIKEMESWGWNAVRLGNSNKNKIAVCVVYKRNIFLAYRIGVMWSGVEPEPGVFNETYITVISDMIDNLEAHGMK